MSLSPAQLAILKADILADGVLSQIPNNSDGNFSIAEAYNSASSPAFIIWKSRVSVSELMNNGFVWTAVDALTAGKARIWEWMQSLGFINPSKANIRQGLQDCFGAGSPMVNGLLPHMKRTASRVEKLFSTGTGTDQQPATSQIPDGQEKLTISFQEVETARNLP